MEAGCTWAKLNEALEATGLRTGYWGRCPASTPPIGGALSQNSAFFGSALNGTVADSVLGVTVVLADGDIVTTGSGGRDGVTPFTASRRAGSDRPLPRRQWRLRRQGRARPCACCRGRRETGFLSFGFTTMAAMAAAQVEMARTRLVSEGFGIDRTKAEHSASVNRI